MTSHHIDDRTADRPSRQGRVIMWIVALVALVVLYFIAAAVIPRWWAQRVADVVNGRLTVGALFGLFIGAVFTIIPLLAGWAVVRWRTARRSWRGWIGWLALIALTATPNLMTLGIVFGSNNAAHAGERILDVDGPGFRVWSLVGAIAGVAAVVAVVYLASSRRHSRRRAGELRDELRSRDQDRPPES